MIGDRKLKQVKSTIRDAFARKGMDVQTWLDEQMAKLRGQGQPIAVEALSLIRDGIITKGTARKRTRAKRQAADAHAAR